MNTLILQPTATADWQTLIKEAEVASHHPLGEDLESYLVFLLIRFMKKAEMANSVLALEFLHSLELAGRVQADQLRDVGDKCLLFAGLFPGRAERRRVRISYFVEMGENAYAHLANMLTQQKLADLYAALRKGFVSLMDVLHAMREIDSENSSLTPLQAHEIWADTASSYALASLNHYTTAIPLYSKISNSKH